MKFTSVVICYFLAMALTAPAVAANSPWSGTWKVDVAKSHAVGDTFTYSPGPNGAIHYSYGTISYNYKCDGKMYVTVPGFSSTCKAKGDRIHDFANYANGKATGSGEITLSADDKTMRSVFTNQRPDGSKETTTTINERVSGTNGWFGTWKSTKFEDSSPATMTLDVSGTTVTSTIPEYKQKMTLTIDGAPGELTGPTLPRGVMASWKSMGPNKVEQTIVYRGKPYNYDIFTLSADGKTLTDVGWTAGKENQKLTTVYDKQ
ncbi:MAG TPA: hypothetical protein VGZ02_05285 [Candidatus Baltobacteraceae bacterium]|jgi:hypothetical protein|nr:hypothetical protein [Candidatus Baltobacteraceae bacterium]